jgi:hypothetical protein
VAESTGIQSSFQEDQEIKGLSPTGYRRNKKDKSKK